MSTADQGEAGTLTSQKDLSKGQAGIAERLIMELNQADKSEKKWREEVAGIEERFANETAEAKSGMNILASNVKTLEPALYNQTPKPDIRRRHRAKDPAAKNLATVSEKAISAAMDDMNFDGVMETAVRDELLGGRAVTRLRYVPTKEMQTPMDRLTTSDQISLIELSEDGPEMYEGREVLSDDDGRYVEGDPFEAVVWERIVPEPVSWDDFRRGPARRWEQVPWVAFRHTMTKDDITETFGAKIASELPFDFQDNKDDGKTLSTTPTEDTVMRRTDVWEVWDKAEGKVCWIHKDFKVKPLKSEPPPLEFEGFFPVPEPLYSLPSSRTLVPIPEYRLYQTQAEELDTLNHRIDKLADALKVRGVYDATMGEIERMLDSEENELIPVENAQKWADKPGGLDNAIAWWPIQRIAEVLIQMYGARDQVKQTIYEITGISDILRGTSDANETATAQGIKSRFGSLRLSRRQKHVQRYARDLIRMMVEVMVENFSPTTIEMMAGEAITPEAWEIAQKDKLRGWKIDIETDSTIAADEQADQKNVTDLLGGLTSFLKEMLPAVQSGAVPREVAQTLMMVAVRRFKLGREIEDSLEAWGEEAQKAEGRAEGQEGQQQQPDPQQQAQQAELQAQQQALQIKAHLEQQKAQMEGQKLQLAAEANKEDHAIKMQELQMRATQNRAEHEVKMHEFQLRQRQAQNAASTETVQ